MHGHAQDVMRQHTKSKTGCEKGDTRCWENRDKNQKKFEGMLAESAEADGDGEGVESTSSSDMQRESVMEELNRLAKLTGMDSIKPYEVLGVPVEATRSEIKRAYRRLSLMLHPDKIKDVSLKETATGVFMDIVAAHELLDHEHKRQAFDDLNTDYQKFDKKTKDKERVAAWLESIKLEEYSASIIDYGYDSMDALDLADEVDVVAMTEDASIGMLKPHRPIFIKHWKCVLSWRLRDPNTRRACAEQKRQEEDKNAEEEIANAEVKALGAEGGATVAAAAAKEEAARRAMEEEVARLKAQERERESQKQEREKQERRSQEDEANRLRKEEETCKEPAVEAAVAAAAAEKEEHARKAKEEEDARQKAEGEDRATAMVAAAAKEEAARRAREEEVPRLKADAEQRAAEKAAAAVRAAEEENQGKEEENRRLEGPSVRQPPIPPVDMDGVGVGKKDNASTMEKCFALKFYGLAKRSVSRFLSAMRRIVKPARGAQGGGRGGTW